MSARPRLLIIDDGERYVELAHRFLRDYDYATRCDLPGPCWTCPQRVGCALTHAHDAAEAEEALARHPDVEVALLDVAFDLPEERLLPLPSTAAPLLQRERPADGAVALEQRRRLQGLAILQRLRRVRGELPIVLMTSAEELALEDQDAALPADELLTLAGADAFDARALGLLVERVRARRRAIPEAGGYLSGRSPAMRRVLRDALTLARTSLPVLILGETGTGKSALAERVLHPATGRRGPFVAVDLSSLPGTLVAAELFGTARGAFSGAVERPGRFEQAHGGTLLLDEIGDLPLDVQRLLLLVLQDGRVTRLGEGQVRPVDVKLIAATHRDLAQAVRAGTFRADLYARLNPAAPLRLPPLRERREDLDALLQTFVRRRFGAGADRALLAAYLSAIGAGAETPAAELLLGGGGPREDAAARNKTGVRFALSASTRAALLVHPFPGNLRELELLIGSAAVFALADAVSAAEEGRRAASAATARLIPIPAKLVRELLRAAWPGEAPLAEAASPPQRAPGEACVQLTLRRHPSLHEVAQDLERQVLERLHQETGGDFAAMAARLLSPDDPGQARRVRLRFNQLGLRARGKPRAP